MEDRRIKRTRNALNQALAELVTEKAYDEITIQEIADRADIGHRTFYRHYGLTRPSSRRDGGIWEQVPPSP